MGSVEDQGGWETVGVDPSDHDVSEHELDRVDPLGALTVKQREVLDLLIEHKTSKEISRLLGISPHTVDQRIMLARAKLHVATRSEVAQAYRKLLTEERNPAVSDICEESIYGSSYLAERAPDLHIRPREDVVPSSRSLLFGQPQHTAVGLEGDTFGQPYHHVLPEMFDGPNGTLLRLGAIVLIAVFLILVVLGGLAMFAQLSQMLDH